MKKIINARINVKAEKIEDFLSLAEVIRKESNLEEGCLVYKLFQEVDNPSSFIFYEEYKNQEAIDYHNSTKHFKTFISGIEKIVSEAPIVEVH